MKLKKWTSSKSIKIDWDKLKKNGGYNMENIIDLKEYSENKTTQILSYSIIDMLLDSKKRKQVYKYYDDHYEETEDEKQIFEAWKKRRTRRNK